MRMRLFVLLLPLGHAALLGPPPANKHPQLEALQRTAISTVLGLSLAVSPGLVGPSAALADADLATKSASEFSQTAGFEEFAADGGKMKADPNCFFKECGPQTKACFSNPACLKGITCLGNCRGEQLCATQCFARFGSEKLNDWLGCTLEDKECVTTGVKQDNTAYYDSAPPAMKDFTPADLEGEWYKVLGYNPKYDTYPCQINTFTKLPDGGLSNDILFRVPKPNGGGAWVNNFKENMADSKGPQHSRRVDTPGLAEAHTHAAHPPLQRPTRWLAQGCSLGSRGGEEERPRRFGCPSEAAVVRALHAHLRAQSRRCHWPLAAQEQGLDDGRGQDVRPDLP